MMFREPPKPKLGFHNPLFIGMNTVNFFPVDAGYGNGCVTYFFSVYILHFQEQVAARRHLLRVRGIEGHKQQAKNKTAENQSVPNDLHDYSYPSEKGRTARLCQPTPRRKRVARCLWHSLLITLRLKLHFGKVFSHARM